MDGHEAVEGTTIIEWGKTTDGKRYDFTYLAGDPRPSNPPVSVLAASCSIYISDVTFHGGGSNA
ncbi:hypothetical protein [Streptomyces sp. KR55]|uniref:hypothetical protein n=1 Tax=Streptomyces sp. KR55 TaxID=3457425 RepID=UPI003FCEEECE